MVLRLKPSFDLVKVVDSSYEIKSSCNMHGIFECDPVVSLLYHRQHCDYYQCHSSRHSYESAAISTAASIIPI